MNANAKAWIQALKSNYYQQATGKLRKLDAYCCLGVACDVFLDSAPPELLTEKTERVVVVTEVTTTEQIVRDALAYDSYLPQVVTDWLGLRDTAGSAPIPDDLATRFTLAQLNDEGYNFYEIACIIEANEADLFGTQ